MPDLAINEAAWRQMEAEAQREAVSIPAQRIVNEARPITRRLSTKPPGRGSFPRRPRVGQLAGAIDWELQEGPDGAESFVGVTGGRANVALAGYQGFGGNPAYGGSRAHRDSIGEAAAAQAGRAIP